MNHNIFRLYAITDRSFIGTKTLEEQVEEALASGVTLLQLREKQLDEDAFLKEALRIRKITERYQVPLIINDNLSVALHCGADGVHLGQGDMPAEEARKRLGPGKLLGITAKTVEQAVEAQNHGADYLGSGAMFPSPTKTNALPMTRETLSAICRSVSIPVTAIGGITAENISRLQGTGIAGAAVVSGIFGQPSIPEAVKKLLEKLDEVVPYES